MEKNIDLKNIILDTLDSNKALDIISIDLKNKSSMADYMIVASGTSSRHIQALSEQVLEKLKENGIRNSKIEGKESNDWKLVDGIDLIVHIFNPEKRKFYELEKIWSELIPKEKVMI
ncbi:ribosome silencing factor [Candidatus Pelagibacter sp.]|jgi:ribosome-associated protein|nr:ribosome silencing factor [Candidatus Pelagibacter sp.]|tara:strand:- start:1643 stop:1993 length:351 start_codon:yes stop_codon:yes gene_type:complete